MPLGPLSIAASHVRRSRAPITRRSTRPELLSKLLASRRLRRTAGCEADSAILRAQPPTSVRRWAGPSANSARIGPRQITTSPPSRSTKRKTQSRRPSESWRRLSAPSRLDLEKRGRDSEGLGSGSPRRLQLVLGHPQRERSPGRDCGSTLITRATAGGCVELSRRRSPVRIRLGVSHESPVITGSPVAAAVLRGRTPAPMEAVAHGSVGSAGTLGDGRLVVQSPTGNAQGRAPSSSTERASANGQPVPVGRGDEDDRRRREM